MVRPMVANVEKAEAAATKQEAKQRRTLIRRAVGVTRMQCTAAVVVCSALASCGGQHDGNPASTQPGANSIGSNTAAPPSVAPIGSAAGAPAGGTNAQTPGASSGDNEALPADQGSPSVADTSTCQPGVPATSQIPRLLNRQYDAVVRDLLGVTTLGGNQPPSSGLYADFDGPMNVDAWRLYQEVAKKVADEVMGGPTQSKFIDCDPAAAGCLTETIHSFGRKAFRRPLTDAEASRFETLLTLPGTPEQIAQSLLVAFLVSPSFLQVTELTTEPEGDVFKLSSYEVAARLSFLLWGSVPDDILSEAADRGELETKEQLLVQAQRMIAVRDKTAPLVAAAHRAYLGADNDESHWFKISHDTSKFPHYSDAALPALESELDLFFEDLAFEGGSFSDLFLSNVGYVNQDTAEIYGLDPTDYGPELTRVTLDAEQRPGFLTRAGFLSSFSHFDATSPILRGAFITINIIGVNPGEPDPDFFLTPPPSGTFNTEREYIEALTSAGNCTGCHTPFINPPGFVLENYDAVGKWQTVDPRSGGDATAGAINPSATVTFSTDNVKPINTARELMEELSKTPLAKRIYAEKAVSFATGRLPNPQDDCTVERIDARLSEDGYTILNLLADLTQADSFRLRTRED